MRDKKYNSTILKHILILLLFLIVSVLLTYPFMFVPLNKFIPAYTIDYTIDPLLNAYILGWDIHKILSMNLHQFFDANIFYPYKLTLAYSENLISTAGLFALPIYLITKNFIVAYNITLFISFILSGFFMYLLAYYLTRKTVPSIIGGIIFAFNFFNFAYISSIQMITAMWLPLIILYLHKYFDRGQYRSIVFASLFFILNATANGYYMLFISLWVCFMFLFFSLTATKTIKRNLIGLCIFSIISGLFIIPVYYPYIELQRSMNFVRSLEEVNLLSFTFSNFISLKNLLINLFLLALIIDLLIITKHKHSVLKDAHTMNIIHFYIIVLVCFYILSFGPFFMRNMQLPNPFYLFLYNYVPGFNGIRNAEKFLVLVILSAAIISSYAFSTKNKPISAIVVCLTLLLCIHKPVNMARIPDNGKVPRVYTWLSQQEGHFAIAELPLTLIPDKDDVLKLWASLYNKGDYSILFNNPPYMGFIPNRFLENERDYYSLYHQKALFNGYSGYFSYLYLASISYTIQKLLILFKTINIKYIVLHKNEFVDPQTYIELTTFLNTTSIARLAKVYTDANTEVYEILDRNKAFNPRNTYLKDYKFTIYFEHVMASTGHDMMIAFIKNIGKKPALFLYNNHLLLDIFNNNGILVKSVNLTFTPFFIPLYSDPFLLPGEATLFNGFIPSDIHLPAGTYSLKLLQSNKIVWEAVVNVTQ